MALYVLREGVKPSSFSPNTTFGNVGHNVNFNCPTNPVIHNATSFSTDCYIFAYISDNYDGSVSSFDRALPSSGAWNTYLENQSTTVGYKIKNHSVNGGEVMSASDISDFATYDYFILIYADDAKQHHFAKITSINSEDTTGDALEFSPKLGGEIPQGTKFNVFKGPLKTKTDIVCITAGLLAISGEQEHWEQMIVSKPLFYYYSDRLDKKDELDHNKKYQLAWGNSTSTSSIAMGETSIFITEEDYGYNIIDKSRYTMKVKLKDNLRDLDDPRLTRPVSNEGGDSNLTNTFIPLGSSSITFSETVFENYGQVFINSRREYNDDYSALFFNGPYRYLRYDYSPTKANIVAGLVDCSVSQSIGLRSASSSAKYLDSNRILASKINNNDALRVRNQTYDGAFNGYFDLDATYTSESAGNYTFTINTSANQNYDLRVVLGQGDEIKVGLIIGVIDTIGAPSAGTQILTFYSFYRLQTDSVFTAGAPSFVDDATVSRKVWSPITQTLLTNYKIDTTITYPSSFPSHPIDDSVLTVLYNGVTLTSLRESRLYNNFVLIGGENFDIKEYQVLYGDALHKCLRLKDVSNSLYRPSSTHESSLNYANQNYTIEIERFSGSIDEIESYIEHEQMYFNVTGRDEFSKLISPSIVKDTLFSEDMVYSSRGILHKCGAITGAISTKLDFGVFSIYFTGTSQTIPNSLGVATSILTEIVEGDLIFNSNMAYIGEVNLCATDGSGDNYIALKSGALAECETTETLYASSGTNVKDYAFNKSLSSNHLANKSVTSLTGAANKGVFFTGGNVIDSDGLKVDWLPEKVIDSDNAKANGFHIQYPLKLKNDNSFQCSLSKINANSDLTQYETFDTINSLMDFEIISLSSGKKGGTIEIAPYIPLTLGRVDKNVSNTNDITLTDTTGFTLLVGTSRLVTISSNVMGSIADGDSVYIDETFPSNGNKIFAGVVQYRYWNGVSTFVYLDRTSTHAINVSVYILAADSKYTHDLYLTNGEHLHGGKTVALLYPQFLDVDWDGTNTLANIVAGHSAHTHFVPCVMDYSTPNLSGTHSSNFGSSYFRIFNVERGGFSYSKLKRSDNFNTDSIQYYHDKPSLSAYYAQGYKYNPAYNGTVTTANNITHYGKTSSSIPYLPMEERGWKPVRGSNFFSKTIFNSSDGNPLLYKDITDMSVNPNDIVVDILEQPDPKTGRLFLFGNTDITPYSSQRKDSLMNQERVLTDYNIMLLNNSNSEDGGNTHSHHKGKGKRVRLEDTDVETVPILSYDRDLSTTKRFGLMRLTELTFDFHFNNVDCENPPAKDRTIPAEASNYVVNNFVDTGLTIDSVSTSGTSLVCNEDVSTSPHAFTTGDILVDVNGVKLGLYNSTQPPPPPPPPPPLPPLLGNEITLQATIINTNEGGLPASGSKIYVYVGLDSTLHGHGSKDTFVKFEEDINLLKGTVFGMEVSEYGSNTNDAFEVEYGATINASNLDKMDMALPFSCVDNGTGTTLFDSAGDSRKINSSTILNHPSILMQNFDGGNVVDNSSGSANEVNTHRCYKKCLALFLDRYSIEDGGNTKLDAGSVSPVLNRWWRRDMGAGKPEFVTLEGNAWVTNEQGFATNKDLTATSAIPLVHSAPYDADGGIMVFKPRLEMVTSTITHTEIRGAATRTDSVGGGISSLISRNNVLHKHVISAGQYNAWLNHVQDLTGCYLVSEQGVIYNSNTVYGAEVNDDADLRTNYTPSSPKGLDNVIPTTVAYVISHEIDTTQGDSDTIYHTIVTDKSIFDSGIVSSPFPCYRVMQPNPVCMYDFTPKTIKLNTLSSAYTKKAYENTCYGKIGDFSIQDTSATTEYSATKPNTGGNEAALSMYVMVDTDKQATSEDIVIRKVEDTVSSYEGEGSGVLDPIDYTMVFSDGVNNIKTTVSTKYNGSIWDGSKYLYTGASLTLGNTKTLMGIVSVTEPIVIKTGKVDGGTFDRAVIGTSVNVCFENEDLVNHLFEENDITFTSQDLVYSRFSSKDIKGQDLFNVVYNLLEEKDRVITFENDQFTVRDKVGGLVETNITISDTDNNIKIKEIGKVQSMFDVYNEITVYGKHHKSTRADFRSIKKIGRKSLKADEEHLITQADVEKRASELLKQHSKTNTKLTIEVSSNSIYHLRAGDIINVELRKENIELERYVVMQVEHFIDGFMKLQLGKYSKGLEDRFSELLTQNNSVFSKLRSAAYEEPFTSSSAIEFMKINPLKLTVRSIGSVAGMTLGFTDTLNTGSTPLGIGDGIIITELVEEIL